MRNAVIAPHPRTVVGWLAGVALLAAASPSHAQAFLPNPGEGAVSVLYQNALVDRHLLSDGSRLDAGKIVSDGLLLDVSYGVSEKMAISFSVPFMTAKYDGARPHPNSLLDDGNYHSGLQDFRFDVRYSAARGPLRITPFVGTILPTHNYPFYGHAAIGRDVKELQVGAYVARTFDPVIPGAFVQVRYAYGIAERLLDVSHNRSLIDAEVGYFINPRFRAFGMSTTQLTHGGIELTRSFPLDLSADELLRHDQISRSNVFDLGGGAQVSVTPTIDLVASVIHTMSGANGHAISYGLTVGASWSFTATALSRQPAHALHRCLCLKGT